MKFNNPITMEEIKSGVPFFFGGFLPEPHFINNLESKAKIVFSVVVMSKETNYNGDSYTSLYLDMYDVETMLYVGSHILQEDIILMKINKSYFGVKFENDEERLKFQLLKR